MGNNEAGLVLFSICSLVFCCGFFFGGGGNITFDERMGNRALSHRGHSYRFVSEW